MIALITLWDVEGGGLILVMSQAPKQVTHWGGSASVHLITISSKSNKPTKCQASKGSKDTASTPKCAKKPAKAKSPTPSPPTPSLPTPPPPPSSSTSPKSSNKSDDSLTNHSFYKSEGNSNPTKEHCTKKAKDAKEPISSSGKKKEASKQALKNPSPPPPDGSSHLPHLTPKMSLRSTPRSSKLLVL
ncbi:hypothetical protein DSO57_1022123 [Entomophthora muscae]|uniref:Uncharacterized protein n=1 Tax=Entomophthora muscae TaxID=34485 RepID=A0ACC2SSH7_9FUNG|nr:hypothetical protein DSO57_1022123 [Entomophthora muscae]